MFIVNISKAANYHLFRIRCTRKHITRHICSVLINSLVIYRIDYSSYLLYNLPASSIAPLNRIIRLSIRSILNYLIIPILTPFDFYQTGSLIKNYPYFDSFLLPINLYIPPLLHIYLTYFQFIPPPTIHVQLPV